MAKAITKPKQKKGRNKGWDNLRPAKPGECRNPKGRPRKELCIPDILREIGDELTTDGTPKKRKILEIVMNLALGGEKWAIEFWADRLEGKSKEHITVNQDIKLLDSKLIDEI